MSAELRGIDKVVANLNRQVKGVRGRSLKGMIRGAIIVRRSMDTTPPLVPVDLGNLRNSWFVETIQRDPPAIFLGFSAAYAFLVHEMVGAHFQRPGAGAKFFEASLKRNKAKILAVIAEEAKVK